MSLHRRVLMVRLLLLQHDVGLSFALETSSDALLIVSVRNVSAGTTFVQANILVHRSMQH